MKRMLIWGRMLPFESKSAGNILSNNLIASNSGNMLFTEAVLKCVMTSELKPDCFYAEDVDRLLQDTSALNDRYSCAIIPLANAFRDDFRPKLRKLTAFLKAARFPCHIIGVGLQAKNEAELKGKFAFDEDVRAFIKAALERTSIIGLRGDYTAEYLKNLGFAPERDFTVIGCPSAFMNGSHCVDIRVPEFDTIKRFAVNAVPSLPAQAGKFLTESYKGMEEMDFIYQSLYELWSIYFPYRRRAQASGKLPSYYPIPNANQMLTGGVFWASFTSENGLSTCTAASSAWAAAYTAIWQRYSSARQPYSYLQTCA